MFKINVFQKNIYTLLVGIIPISLIAGSLASNLILFLISISLIYLSYYNKNWDWVKSDYFKLFLLFYVYLIFNSIISSNIEISIIRSIGYIKFLFLAIFIKLIFEKKLVDFRKISIIWLLTLLCLSFDIFYQSYFGENIIGYKVSNPLRNSSFFFDELKAAALIVGFGFICFYDKFYKSKIILLILSIFLLAALITGERANFIRYLFLFSFFIFVFSKRVKVINLKSLTIFSVLIIFIFNFFGEKIIERYSRTISLNKNNEKLSLVETYLSSHYGAHAITAYNMFKDNILFGVGNKNFRIECKKYEEEISKRFNNRNYLGCSTHPHQTWHELISEHGLVGTIIIMYFVYALIKLRLNKKLEIINIMALVYIMNLFIPILPFGSIFTSYNSTILWINFSIYITEFNNK